MLQYLKAISLLFKANWQDNRALTSSIHLIYIFETILERLGIIITKELGQIITFMFIHNSPRELLDCCVIKYGIRCRYIYIENRN